MGLGPRGRRQGLSGRRGRRRDRHPGGQGAEGAQGEQHGELGLCHARGGQRSSLHHEPQRAVRARRDQRWNGQLSTQTETVFESRDRAARLALDAWVREVVEWHFDPKGGTPFWLDFAQQRGWDPRADVRGFDDLGKFGLFEDEWLRGGPVSRWVPKAYPGKPVFVFETGGTTGIPK